jgi:hypothetical protein
LDLNLNIGSHPEAARDQDEAAHAAVYESRLVLYADVLGWKAAVEGNDGEALLSVVEELHLPADAHNARRRAELQGSEGKIIETSAGSMKIEWVNPMFLEVQFGAFSDNFVFSVPASFGRRILTAASSLVVGLLRRGFLVRGAITLGELHHRDNAVFGPALNRAVQIETREAFYPRILVSDETAKHLAGLPTDSRDHSLLTDQTGRLVANPFALPFDGPAELIASAVQMNLHPTEIDAVIARQKGKRGFSPTFPSTD